MRDEYDFSKARKNPYSTKLKKSITIRLDEDSVGDGMDFGWVHD